MSLASGVCRPTLDPEGDASDETANVRVKRGAPVQSAPYTVLETIGHSGAPAGANAGTAANRKEQTERITASTKMSRS
jgi:hypothetical protein